MQERILDSTYRLLEEIGRGGFGAVWRAVRLGAEGSGAVAIKLLSRGNVPTLQEQIRFQREATLMSQLLHPGTVTVYELGETEGRAYIVMEYIDGPNLREFVRSRGGRLPLTEILEVLIQAAEALEYVHGHNIVHRDIKPQNILVSVSKEGLDSKPQIKIVDFGVARLNDPSRQQPEEGRRGRSEVVGTFNYIAPESTGLMNVPIDARTDIYSLGIVAYELITGRTPFHEFRNESLLRAHVEKSPPPFSEFDSANVPDVLERIVRKCIEKKPEQRYQSMFGLLTDLRRLLSGMRAQKFEDFEIAKKDVALTRIFNNIFVGRGELVEQVTRIIAERQRRSRVTWSMVRSTVGLGRTRCLSEIKRSLNDRNISFLHIRFTESEQRLPLRALSLAVNEQLQALEASSPHVFQSLMQDMALIAGKGALDVARLIPALRPHIFRNSTITATHDTVGKEAEESGEESLVGPTGTPDFLSSAPQNKNLNRRSQPHAPIQQIFSELLGKIAEQKGYLVFLLDDLHLADNQSIGLFQFITERVNDTANFAFVMTIREGIAPTNFVLENFLVRLNNLRRRFHVWDLAPLNQYDFQQFLQAVGLQRPSPRFVEFITAKCDGSPLLLHQLLKQMVESDALLLDGDDFDPWAPKFRVDWSKLSQIVVDTRNIEALLASLDRMDKRDKKITSISAVSYEACEFEYFRFDQEFTSVELETRLLSLVRRGVFEMLGDENAPVQRRSFVFTHEKLRAAVLGGLDAQYRRQLHLSLANRIIYLYPKPRKEHVLSLAKHFEGAGTLADAERASMIFLKAAQIYAKNFEHSLSKYYTERAMQRASTIGNQQERLARLREVFETEYTIHIAQNELVAASEVCQQLVALTFEQSKKEILQVHWSNLLLGLGQHRKAYTQLKEAVDRHFPFPFSSLNQGAARFIASLSRLGLFSMLLKILTLKPFRKSNPGENNSHALMYMTLAQAHGADGHSMPLLTAALQYQLHRSGPSRIVAVFNMMIAIHALRFGKIDQAFDIAERLERSLDRSGRVDVVRWVRALRAIWIDYPMGRMERLARVLDARKEGQVPSSGILRIESSALRSWIRATSPRIWRGHVRANDKPESGRQWANKEKTHPGGYVHDRATRSRKLEGLVDHRKQGAAHADSHRESLFSADLSPKSKKALQIQGASECGQYTGLSLFSDVVRFSLSDQIDPLRHSVDQFSRQKSGSGEGAVFKHLSLALHDLVASQPSEALSNYVEAIKHLIRMRVNEISLPISDAIRVGLILVPLLSRSQRARGWPWGRSMARVLERAQLILSEAEGNRNPRRTPISPLFEGVRSFHLGDEGKALRLLGEAKDMAKSAQNDLVAAVAQQFMGLACAQSDEVRAIDYLAECYRISKDLGWRMFERQLLSLCRYLNLPLQRHFPELLAESEKLDFRRHSSGIAVNLIVESWLVTRREASTVNHYIAQAPKVAAKIVASPMSVVFELSLVERQGWLTPAKWVDDGSLFLQKLGEANNAHQQLEAELQQNIPKFHDDPIRLVSSFQWNNEISALRLKPTEHQFGAAPETLRNRKEQTEIETLAYVDNTRTQFVVGSENQQYVESSYSAYFALKFSNEFLGWLAVASVPMSSLSNHESELELLLLTNQTAFNLWLSRRLMLSEQALEALPRTLQIEEISKPSGIEFEVVGVPSLAQHCGTVIHTVNSDRVLVAAWSFESANRGELVTMSECLQHYINLLVASLRMSGQQIQLDKFALRLSSDVGALLERMVLSVRFDQIKISTLLIDTKLGEAQECVFGPEQLTFSGSSRIERELLLELSGVLRLDKLVYRERRRVFEGSHLAWMFSHDPRFRKVIPYFSRPGFLDEYFNLKKTRGLDLARVLAGGDMPDEFSGTAVIVDNAVSNKGAA